ncbi:MAG: FAD-dependent oxidoreductase [Myxococcota bacterium]|nr:FAD-dependent oxidoreductase [Myxococcota bacterium]
MVDVIIVGDGPGGLSAALLLAKNDAEVVLFGQDRTAMHAAMLHNYLGVEALPGSDFQKMARSQVQKQGALIRDEQVKSIERSEGQFAVTVKAGDVLHARYVVLSEGKSTNLAKRLGVDFQDNGAIVTDIHGLTSQAGVYAVGRSRRPGRSQAIISAGDGAAVAIDILSRERGEDFCDWDVPE